MKAESEELETKPCTRCNGEGFIGSCEIYSDGSYGGLRECPTCRGSGRVMATGGPAP